MPTEELFNSRQLMSESGESLLGPDIDQAIREHAMRLDAATSRLPCLGISVMNADGKLMYAKGFASHAPPHPVTGENYTAHCGTESQFRIGSITKILTATAILRLVDQGALGLNDELADLIPSFAPTPLADRTVREFLDHSSGFSSSIYEGEEIVDHIYRNYEEASRRFNNRQLPIRRRHLIDLIRATTMENDAALVNDGRAAHNYDNVNYLILGEILSATTGRGIITSIRQLVVNPLQMDATEPAPRTLADRRPNELLPFGDPHRGEPSMPDWTSSGSIDDVDDRHTASYGYHREFRDGRSTGTWLSTVIDMQRLVREWSRCATDPSYQGMMSHQLAADVMLANTYYGPGGQQTLGWRLKGGSAFVYDEERAGGPSREARARQRYHTGGIPGGRSLLYVYPDLGDYPLSRASICMLVNRKDSRDTDDLVFELFGDLINDVLPGISAWPKGDLWSLHAPESKTAQMSSSRPTLRVP